MTVRRLFLSLIPALLCLATARALPGAEDSPQTEPPKAAREARLEAEYAALQQQAARLAAAYEKAIADRIAELAATDPTIAYLVEKNLLSPEAFTRGLPADPLARVPWLRTTYASVERRARRMAARFGDLTLKENERAAIRALLAIAQAQERYRATDADGNGVFDYAERFDQLVLEGFEPDPEAGYLRHRGYRFRLLHGDVLSWSAEALPIEPGKSGRRFFFIDERGQVRERVEGPADAKSPVAPEQAKQDEDSGGAK